jgi:hypothetical protein
MGGELAVDEVMGLYLGRLPLRRLRPDYSVLVDLPGRLVRRLTPLKPSSGTRIPDDIRHQVEYRDRMCVGAIVLMPGDCAGGLELDHVRAGGMGLKSRSTVDNLVRLCGAHHRVKTENGREWRPILIDYIEGRL